MDVAAAVGGVLGGAWRTSRAARGSSRRSFVVTDGTRRLFVKLGTDIDVLRRVGEIGVSPAVVANGELRGHAFVVQELVNGRRPARTWFAGHIEALAGLVATYQRDATLRRLLGNRAVTAAGYAGYLGDRASRETRGENAAAFVGVGTRVARLASSVDTDELVPTHGDPNTENFIVRADAVHLVDWDDAALMDPLRDIGQLLWWYVAPAAWPRFFDAYGIADGDALRHRLHWWVAAESLEVALRLAGTGDDPGARDFLADAAAALAHRPNPRA